ncbi:hypothetical protein Hanom_Chr17g01584451 [Helianthus anomalus]
MVFLSEFGIGLMYFQMKYFQPSKWMGAAIVNCFALVLNFEVVNKTNGTDPRLFCHIDCIVSFILNLFLNVMWVQIHINKLLVFWLHLM